MRRVRKLGVALLALAVVIAAVYATGAFTSTTASRSADVDVAGDASAFLALEGSDGPNGQFATPGPNGELQVRMGGAATGGTGVNPDSTTEFADVFTITNKGTQPVSVWLTGGSEAVTFVGPDGRSVESERGAVTLRPGGRPVHVGLRVDARGVEPGTDLLESVTVRTKTGDTSAGAPAAGGNEDGTNDGTGTRTTASDPAVPIAGGPIPRSLGDGRFYSVGKPRDLGEADGPVGLAGAVARRIAPFGSLLGSVLTDHEECSAGSAENSETQQSVPDGPTVPTTETPESTESTEETPRHATRPACEDRDDSGSNNRPGNSGGGFDDRVTKSLTVATSLSPLSYVATAVSNKKNDSSRGPSGDTRDSSVSNNSPNNSAKVSPRWGKCVPGELMSDENEREWCKASANDIPSTSTNPAIFGAKAAVTIGMDLERTYGDEVANKSENADEVDWIDGDGDGENDIDEFQEVFDIDNDSDEDDDDDGVVDTWP